MFAITNFLVGVFCRPEAYFWR